MTESTDPYLYQGTDVLKNLRDIRDPNTLSRFEAESNRHENFLPPTNRPHFILDTLLRRVHCIILTIIYPLQ